jgi:hypothetical protein
MFCKGNEFFSRNRATVIKHSDIIPFAICIFKILAERKVKIFIPFIIPMSFGIAAQLFKTLVQRASLFPALRNIFRFKPSWGFS